MLRSHRRLAGYVLVDELPYVANELLDIDVLVTGIHVNDRAIQLQRIPSLVDDARNQFGQRRRVGVAWMTFTGACATGEALNQHRGLCQADHLHETTFKTGLECAQWGGIPTRVEVALEST